MSHPFYGQDQNRSSILSKEKQDDFFPREILDAYSMAMVENMVAAGGLSYGEDYLLGPGDRVSIQVDGTLAFTVRGTMVNAEGVVLIPKLGKVKLGGLQLKEAEQVLSEQVSKVFANSTAALTLDIPRPVKIKVMGFESAGISLTLPPYMTLSELVHRISNRQITLSARLKQFPSNPTLNPYYYDQDKVQNPFDEQMNTEELQAVLEREANTGLNSGVNDYFRLPNRGDYLIGIRAIRVRAAEHEQFIDLADVLVNGKTGGDYLLADGDVVYFDLKKNHEMRSISLTGAVHMPFSVDFLEGDTPARLLAIADGFSEQADSSYISLIREEGGALKTYKILAQDFTNFKLQANDHLIAHKTERAQTQERTLSVWVRGEVKQPGNYPLIEEQHTLADLLVMSGGFTKKALPSAAYIRRVVSSESGNEIEEMLRLRRTSDQVLEGLSYVDFERSLSRGIMHVNLTDSTTLADLKLFDGDQLIIPVNQQTVEVFGQVSRPGHYPAEVGKSVEGYVSQAGGMTLAAEKTRIFVIKAGSMVWMKPEETIVENGDKIFVDRYVLNNAQVDVQRQQVKNQRFSTYVQIAAILLSTIPTYILLARR